MLASMPLLKQYNHTLFDPYTEEKKDNGNIILSHKIEFNANNKQKQYFKKACGVARFSYNWALDNWAKMYNASLLNPELPKPSQSLLRKQLNAIKREEFPWMLDVTKNAPQMAIIHLGQAFQRFFKGKSKYPSFKKKGIKDSFEITNDQFSIKDKMVRIPNLGWVRLRESLKWSGKIISGTVSRRADRWYISVSVELDHVPTYPNAKNQGVVGVDLGVSRLATLSAGDEREIDGSKELYRLEKKLKKHQRRMSRAKKGSMNREKLKLKVARLHSRIVNCRQDCLHKLTTRLTMEFDVTVIEDLNVKGMLRNHKLAKAIANMGFHEFKRQLLYKAKLRGRIVIVANRWFPSSKLCSNCHHKVDHLPLSIRHWTCPSCGVLHDRDGNAANNLAYVAFTV